jgi:hypothetical protein
VRALARRTEEERLVDLEEKIRKMQLEKQRLANQVRQKERKERTRRLIQVGGLIEKHFEIEGQEETIKLIASFKEVVLKNKNKMLAMDINDARKVLKISKED